MFRLRGLIPRPIRRSAARPVAYFNGVRIRRRLADIASTGSPVLAGPWLGEVGFEILYWAPFVRWFASEFQVPPDRLTVLSRGGTAGWYAPAAGSYHEVFDYLSVSDFRRWRGEHVGEVGEQKQTRITTRDRHLLALVMERLPRSTAILHPSVMYELMNPYWWQHLDERWIERHTRYRQLDRPPRVGGVDLPDRYVAAKFYYNDCFPATEANRAFVSSIMKRLADEGPVVQLSTGAALDDHADCNAGGCAVNATAVGDNLRVQSAIVANAERFVGTYGGFSYLAPFYGVPSTAYFADPAAFSRAHLRMAQRALGRIGTAGLLDVRPAGGAAA